MWRETRSLPESPDRLPLPEVAGAGEIAEIQPTSHRRPSLWRTLWRALKLDTMAANHVFTSEQRGLLADSHPLRPEKVGAVRGVLRVARVALSRFSMRDLRAWTTGRHRAGPVFFTATRNQFDSLEGPMAALGAPLLAVHGRLRAVDLRQPAVQFPVGAAAALALLFVPAALFSWLRTHGYPRRSFRYVFDQHCLAYGMYVMWARFLANGSARCLVVANDHSVVNRVAIEAARQAGVSTVYVQHASVTSAFPRLAVDFALLEGEDALRKYEQAGPAPVRVYLVGMPKADRFELHSARHAPPVVGLCFNEYDTSLDVEAACRALRGALPAVSILVRPHPRSSEAVVASIRDISATLGCDFSNSREEGVAAFLKRIDVLVAGESSVHLEAVLCDIPTLYFTGGRPPADVYGYRAHGLVGEHLGTLDELTAAVQREIASNESIRHRARYYVDTVGTRYDGHSTDVVAQIIQQVSERGTVVLKGWRLMENESFSEVWRAQD